MYNKFEKKRVLARLLLDGASYEDIHLKIATELIRLIIENQMIGRNKSELLDRHRLGEISRLVYVAATLDGDVVGKQLEWYGSQ
jgi:hypothetical protein